MAANRVAGLVRGLKTQAAATQARLEQARKTVPAVNTAFAIWGYDQSVGGNLMACAVAYRLFLWLLSFALVLAAILGFLNASPLGDPSSLVRDLGMSAFVTSSVRAASEQAEQSRWVMLVIGLWALYIASAAGAKTVAAVHGLVWGMDIRKPKSTPKGALAFAGFITLCLFASLGAQWVRARSIGLGLGASLFILAVYSGVALGAIYLLPHRDAPWQRLLPGAMFLAVGAQLMHLLTVYYLANKVASASALYGSLGSAAAVLLWLYLIGRLLVGSASLNAMLWDRSLKAQGVQPAGDPAQPAGPAPEATGQPGRHLRPQGRA